MDARCHSSAKFDVCTYLKDDVIVYMQTESKVNILSLTNCFSVLCLISANSAQNLMPPTLHHYFYVKLRKPRNCIFFRIPLNYVFLVGVYTGRSYVLT